jgi:TonB family protein
MRIAASVALLISLAAFTSAQTTPPASTDLGKEAPAGSVFKVGGGVTAPRLIHSSEPKFSREARKKKVQGTCILSLVIGADGSPRDISVTRPLGFGLDDEAIKAVEKWRFEPAHKDGQPVKVRVNVEVNFKLY